MPNSTVYTKRAQEVFNPVDAANKNRGAKMEEAQLWGTEIEKSIATTGSVTYSRSGAPSMALGVDGETYLRA